MTDTKAQTKELATLGGGCFWCTEAVFSRVKGVTEVKSGYSGGHVKKPSYKEVTTGLTGHAEVIQITFDNTIISYSEILDIFFKTHDPTQLNRQGNDVGTQYRSVVFFHDNKQKLETEKLIHKLNQEKIWDKPIVTTVEVFDRFYPAEDYHDNYYENNPNQGYCRFIIAPKIQKFEGKFKDYLIAH